MRTKIPEIIKAQNVTNANLVKYLQDEQNYEKFCEYAQWAYIESVPLNESMETLAHAPCAEIMKQKALSIAKYENSTARNVTTNEMRLTMQKSLDNFNKDFSKGKSKAPYDYLLLDQQEMLEKKGKKLSILEGTAGTENPNVYMFWTNPQYLEQLALSIADQTDVSAMLPLTPSSTIILELYSDDSFFKAATELSVKLYINDQEVKTPLCAGATHCKVADFITAIGATVNALPTADICNLK